MAGKTAPQKTEFSIGVMALQGAFREHLAALSSLGIKAREVRLPADLAGLRGLIIPGGESTTMAHLMSSYGLWEAVQAFHAGGAIWGTCAGAILLAKRIEGGPLPLGSQNSSQSSPQTSLALLDITARRNAFGRQVDSFGVDLQVEGLSAPFPAVFIRAPILEQPGPEVEVLARYGDAAVLVRQGRVMASSFHPELTQDSRLHQLFLELITLR